MEGFTIIDGVVALVIVLSALLAYGRGLVREFMAIVGWIAAAILGPGMLVVAYNVFRVAQAVIVRVGNEGIHAADEFLRVARAIAIGIGLARIRVEQRDFEVVGDLVAV